MLPASTASTSRKSAARFRVTSSTKPRRLISISTFLARTPLMDGSGPTTKKRMLKTCLMAALLAMACAFAWQGSAMQKDKSSSNASTNSQTVEIPPAQKKILVEPTVVAAPHVQSARRDHIGKPLPDYMTGDQCLLCHQRVVGPTWQKEPHAWTIREVGVPPVVAKAPADTTHIIGS